MNKEWIFANGCLTPDKHGPLVAEITKCAAIAGLGGHNIHYVWEALEKDKLTEPEIDVLQNIKKLGGKGIGGALYVGQPQSMIIDRLMAITGCMLRNYVDARYMPLEKVIDEYSQNKSITAEVVCVPNFHTDATYLADWRMSLLHDFVLQHLSEGKLLIGYVQSAELMRSAYPDALYQLLYARYLKIGGTL